MDIDYNEVFGIETSENTQEAAAPAEPEETEGAKEQPVAEADVEEDKQTDDENAKYAAARRKAEEERDRAVAQAKQDAQREIDEAFRTSGLTNPYSGKPIASKKDYDEYKQQFEADREKKIASGAGMTEDEFRRYIADRPEVREAKRAAADAQAAKAQAAIDEQVKEIGKLDANIQSVKDFSKMENFPQFYDLVKRGYSFVDAYKIVNFDKLTDQKAQAAKTAEEKKRAGKEHLSSTSTRGSGAQTVPADVAEQYRLLMPDITDAEIRDHYNSHHRRN